MKKLGFTLAEVLITLGIIGVVAALTAPALIQNTGSAQIGPKLAKAVSTFENANETMLTTTGATKVSTVGAGEQRNDRLEDYAEQLSNFMKMNLYEEAGQATEYGSTENAEFFVKDYKDAEVTGLIEFPINTGVKYLSKDGFLYAITFSGIPQNLNRDKPIHKQIAGYVAIDINGTANPNRLGRDVFGFSLREDGTLSPMGSSDWYGDPETDARFYWKDGTADQCNEETVTTGMSCAGSIFENNLEVIYQ